MWLRRLVAASMILALFGMNGLVIAGITAKPKGGADAVGLTFSAPVATPVPTITLSVEPDTIAAGTTSAIKWTATNSPSSCSAAGDWDGAKTPVGAESTGRVSDQRDHTYKITCTNDGGSSIAEATLHVGPPGAAPVATSTSSGSSSGTAKATVTYCGGQLPCYGPRDVASHSGGGNCWGWNGNRVINISGFDSAFHQAKTGISSIEVSGVCGKDLSGAIGGSVGASGAPAHNHTSSTKANADRNEIAYFVGYFDPNK